LATALITPERSFTEKVASTPLPRTQHQNDSKKQNALQMQGVLFITSASDRATLT